MRADGHELFFFMYAPLVVGLAVMALQLRPRMIAWCVFLGTAGLSAYDRPGLLATDHFRSVADRPRNYLMGLQQEVAVSPIMPGASPFSAHTVAQVGDGGADIFPWEVADLLAAKIPYVGRPVLQSYVASNGYLDGLNAAFFASERAPNSVLFRYGTIDGRYPMFDETATKRELLRRYEPVGQDGAFHVLRRRLQPRELEVGKWESLANGALGRRYPLSEYVRPGEVLELSFEVPYSPLGSLAKTFYKPPELRLRFALEDGSKREFRAVRPILAGGVMVAPYVETDSEVAAWFRADFDALPRVKGVVLVAANGWGFQGRYQVRARRVKVAAAPQSVNRGGPIPLP